MVSIDLVAVHIDLRDIGITTTFERRPSGSNYLMGSADGVVFDVFENDCAIYHGALIGRVDDVVQRHRRTLTEAGR